MDMKISTFPDEVFRSSSKLLNDFSVSSLLTNAQCEALEECFFTMK